MKPDRPQQDNFRQAGTTLIELMLAVLILVIVCTGLLSLFAFTTGQNKKQGEIATRTTEYCEDKLEQLMGLQFSDTSTDTTKTPWSPVTYSAGYSTWSASTSYVSGANVNYLLAANTTSHNAHTSWASNVASNLNYPPGTTSIPTGGTGLGGPTPSTTYGGINPSSPVTGYVDYLDEFGNLSGTANFTSNFYIRVWQIQNDATGNIKYITVVASDLSSLSLGGVAPSTTLTAWKANF